VRSVWEIGGLITHREGIDAYAKLFVEPHVQMHALEQVGRAVVKIVEHVVAEIIELTFMRVADGLLVWLLETQVVESDAEWAEADAGKFAQVHAILAEDARINPLVEVHAAL